MSGQDHANYFTANPAALAMDVDVQQRCRHAVFNQQFHIAKNIKPIGGHDCVVQDLLPGTRDHLKALALNREVHPNAWCVIGGVAVLVMRCGCTDWLTRLIFATVASVSQERSRPRTGLEHRILNKLLSIRVGHCAQLVGCASEAEFVSKGSKDGNRAPHPALHVLRSKPDIARV